MLASKNIANEKNLSDITNALQEENAEEIGKEIIGKMSKFEMENSSNPALTYNFNFEKVAKK